MALDFGVNAGLVEELFAQYLENPGSVDPAWHPLFEARTGSAPNKRNGPPAPAHATAIPWPRSAPPVTEIAAEARSPLVRGDLPPNPPGEPPPASTRAIDAGRSMTTDAPPAPKSVPTLLVPMARPSERDVLAVAAIHARVYKLLNAYRVRGHLFAHVDPLDAPHATPPELDLRNFDLTPDDLDKPFPTADLAGAPPVLTLREIIRRLEDTYCRTIGVEFTHIDNPEQRRWLQERMESTQNHLTLGVEQQLRILTKLTDAEIFEQFIGRSYGAGTKRFSLEGAESLIPLLDLLVERAGDQGVIEIVMGMAHRGRLNVLANILGKSVREIFAHFEDADAEANLGSGDVKYHLGYSTDRVTSSGKKLHLTMTFNPSHLEIVNPVVVGRTRAKQDRHSASYVTPATQPGSFGRPGYAPSGLGGNPRRLAMPLLVHGDAAFIGQGVVAETLNLANLPGYTVGGTVHVIVNNQIGFTTNPEDSRSSRYATDIVRMLKVPVFHVNGEDPEAVAHVAQLAIDWRQRFGHDVVIDMYCYRRHGHNEGDEPRYTQPQMYALIDKKPTVRQVYVRRLVEMGHFTADEAEELAGRRREVLTSALQEVKQTGFAPVTYAMGGVWAHYRGGQDTATPEVPTGVPIEKLRALSQRLLELPADFKAHPKVLPMLRARHEAVMSGEPFDWGTGETLAYASLLAEKTLVRISGQDVKRGTFSHRHAVLFDTDTGDEFAPLSRVAEWPGRFDIYNSPLSEQGVLGFEFGVSLDYPDALVIWEAQFGDFLNCAQVIVDQFLTSSEDKWHRLSGLVLYLPHGYEGQGPEHSSARVERFLQNSAEDNVQVCNLTTPAQLFHALRRQVHRPWRKPLVILTPKSMLRVAASSKGPHRPVSTIHDLAEGKFHRVIGDQAGLDPADVKKILLCTGKIYYDLALEREARKAYHVAIVRLEQLYPINDDLKHELAPYRDGTPLVWVQEEPHNYGPWYYINANLPELLGGRFPLSCAARARSASPATGSRASHLLEQKMLIDEAFS